MGATITTTATAFQLNNNAISQTGGGVIPIAAGVTGLYQGTGRVLHVAATGTITGATSGSTTLNIKIYEVPAAIIAEGLTPTSFTGWNSVCASGAKAITGTSGSWSIDARVQLDNAGNLDGSFQAQIDSAAITSPAATTQVTGLVGEADLNFAVVAAVGTDASTGLVTMDELRIDLE